MKTRHLFFWTLLLLVPGLTLPVNPVSAQRPITRIGIVRDGPGSWMNETLEIFQKEILVLTADEFDVRFPEDANLHGNWSVEGIRRAIDSLMNRRDVDMALAIGILSSSEMAKRKSFPKPVVASIVPDADLQGLPLKNGTSGVRNLSYIDLFIRWDRIISAFQDIAHFKHLAILADDLYTDAGLGGAITSRMTGHKSVSDVRIIKVSDSAVEALEKLPQATDAVLVMPLLRFDNNETRVLARGLIEKKLPSFSFQGLDEVEMGILAGIAPKSDFLRIARRLALNVQRILLGEDAGELNVHFSLGEKLTLNMATAQAIGFSPSWDILAEADLINEAPLERGRKVSLKTAVREVLERNPDLQAARRKVAAGAQTVHEAKSFLLPQVDGTVQGLVIDENRAEASGGLQAQRTWTGSLTASQLIYSEKARSNHTIEHQVQISRGEALETLTLDILQETLVTYLDVLRAQVAVKIREDNLKLTRANLDRSRVRKSIGMAGPMEVYRWESEIAKSRIAVINARTQAMKAREALSLLMARPLNDLFHVADATIADLGLVPEELLLEVLIDTPKDFGVLIQFMVR
ncbi:MAG: TolC family protein, partial [Deltaproteobacteria bacterium]|nr:TolC family protein [Deltaproteobacteria bacterium]